jgi:nitrogen fixation protein FixH
MSAAAQRQFTGRQMLALMLAFFAVVIAANLTMVYFASHSWTGLVVKNSYVASQEFNEKTSVRELAAGGVRSHMSYANGVLRLILTDPDQRPVHANAVHLRIGRASHEAEDRHVAFASESEGVFVAREQLGPGKWTGEVDGDIPGHPGWEQAIELHVKE